MIYPELAERWFWYKQKCDCCKFWKDVYPDTAKWFIYEEGWHFQA